ncbi:MAG: SIMPL domain-containing protein [Candidatus Paceibacterota bacterium]|jgi:hypothetical protein
MKNHPRCKKFLRIVLAIIIAIIVVEAFDCDRRDTEQKDTIVVAGKGELTVKPDIATISFSVMEENMDVSKASDAVNKKIAKIMDVLKADSVDEKDIKTTDYNIYPRYDYTSAQIYPYRGTQVLAGYDVTQSITVKIRDLSKAGKIITDLGTLGVTNMSGLSFTEDKYDELVKEARDQAIAQARTEAKKLAKALGVRLGKIVGYSEGANYPTYYKSAVMDSSMGMGGATEAVIPTGENKITSSVSVTYEIK